eukprot:Filipodium_phascolosomae@DN3418_c0_g1_i1.p1
MAEQVSSQWRLIALLESATTSDVTMRCGNTSIKAHRCIIAAHSDVFKRILFDEEQAQQCEISVEVDSRVFHRFMSYFYGSTVTVTAHDFSDIFKLALHYNVRELLSQLDKIVGVLMNKSLASSLWDLFDVASETIRHALLDHITKHLNEYSMDMLKDMSADKSRAIISHLWKTNQTAMQDNNALVKVLHEKEAVKDIQDKMLASAIQEKELAVQEKEAERITHNKMLAEALQEKDVAMRDKETWMAGVIQHSSVLKKHPDVSLTIRDDGLHVILSKQDLDNPKLWKSVFNLGIALEDCPLENAYDNENTFVWNTVQGTLWTGGKEAGKINKLNPTEKEAMVCLDMTSTPYKLWVRPTGNYN